MATFFQAWRRREANQHAAEWAEERESARIAVAQAPAQIRRELQRVIETLLDGPDDAVESALEELWKLLEPYPALRESFSQLRVVEDAVRFLNNPADG